MSNFAVFGIVDIGGKILLVQERGNFQTKMWKLPGGRPNGEYKSPEMVLLNEFDQETDVVIAEPKKENLILTLPKKGFEVLFYRVDYYSGTPAPKNEIERCELFTPSDIIKMIEAGEILSDHAQGLSAYFAKAASSI